MLRARLSSRDVQRTLTAITSGTRHVVVSTARWRMAVCRFQSVSANTQQQNRCRDSVEHRVEVSRHVELTIREATESKASSVSTMRCGWAIRSQGVLAIGSNRTVTWTSAPVMRETRQRTACTSGTCSIGRRAIDNVSTARVTVPAPLLRLCHGLKLTKPKGINDIQC